MITSSIHTTIVGPSRQRIELQIRTRRMNDIAEYGIAAHTLYKDNPPIPDEADDAGSQSVQRLFLAAPYH